jgi:hypothetical protein
MTTKKHFEQRVKPKETIGTTIEFVSISQGQAAVRREKGNNPDHDSCDSLSLCSTDTDLSASDNFIPKATKIPANISIRAYRAL